MTDQTSQQEAVSDEFKTKLESFERWWHDGVYPFRNIDRYSGEKINDDNALAIWFAACAKHAQQAVESERDKALEQAANICDEYEDLTGTEKDSALLVGEVALSIAMSGEPRAARFLAEQIRALKSQQPAPSEPEIDPRFAAACYGHDLKYQQPAQADKEKP